jgi:hypothetical protein
VPKIIWINPTKPYCHIKKINPRIPRKNILATIKNKTRASNHLLQFLLLMVTNEQNPKVRILTDIEPFEGNMVMWSLDVLKRWKP